MRKTPSASSSSRGKARRSIGASSEGLIEMVHAMGANRGLLLSEKIQNAWRVMRRISDKEVVCVPGVKTGVDYRGVLKGGRALYAECKHCSSPSFGLSNVQENQWNQLSAAEDLGAACFLLIVWEPDGETARKMLHDRRFPGGPTLVAFPWSKVRAIKDGGSSSIPTEDMLEHARPWSFYAEGAIK